MESLDFKKQTSQELSGLSDSALSDNLMEHIPFGVFIVDIEGCVAYWSRGAELIFGWNSDEVLGQKNPVSPPCQSENFLKFYNMVISGKSFSGHRGQPKCKNGASIEARISGTPLYDAGKVTGALFIVEDVTRHVIRNRQAFSEILKSSAEDCEQFPVENLLFGDDVGSRSESANELTDGNLTEFEKKNQCFHSCWALNFSEQRYRLLVETMCDGLLLLGRNGALTYVNESFARMLGYSRESILGRNILEFVAPESCTFVKNQLKMEDCCCKGYELTWITNEKQTVPTIVSSQELSTIGIPTETTFIVVTDISDQKRVQKELEEKTGLLQSEHKLLEETNATLRVLLQKRNEDKAELEQKVIANVHELLFPIIERLHKTALPFQKSLLELLEKNIREIVSPFSRTLFFQNVALSPRELQVANYVRMGMSTKDIAEMTNLSHKTVEDHRKTIRRKLGLKENKSNLRNYLNSMQD